MSRCDLPGKRSLPTPVEWIRRNKDKDLLWQEIEAKARRYENDDARSDKPPKTKREYIDAAIEWAARDYMDVYDRVCTFLTRLMNEKNPTIYREMKVEDVDEFIRQLRENGGRTVRCDGLEGIGTSWTWDEGSASAVWGEDEPCTVLIRARVQDVDDIDFDLTLDLALVYVGFDENEVKMTKDSPVVINRITVVHSDGCKQEGKTYRDLDIKAYT